MHQGSCRKDGRDDLIAGMEHSYDPNDFNRRFYHATGEGSRGELHMVQRSFKRVKELVKIILKDAAKLLEACEADFGGGEPYQLLRRCINEQTVEEDGALRIRTREDGGYDSRTMQSGADPEATIREKAGKVCRGYAGNVVEAVGENGTAVIDCQCGENTESDSQFLRKSIANRLEQEKVRVVVADGAYGGYRAA